MKTLNERASCLKDYEVECYSICYFLLQKENLAIDTAKRVLKQLLYDDGFYMKDGEQRKMELHKLTKKFAIKAYQINVANTEAAI